MLPPHKVRLNKESTTLRLTMIFKQPLILIITGSFYSVPGLGTWLTARHATEEDRISRQGKSGRGNPPSTAFAYVPKNSSKPELLAETVRKIELFPREKLHRQLNRPAVVIARPEPLDHSLRPAPHMSV